MPRKKNEISIHQRIMMLKKAGIRPVKKINTVEDLLSLNERIQIILELNENQKKDKTKMLFFVMYDIENNKIRRLIAKFLQRNGCVRVQKSIFFASAPHETYRQIHKTISAVQEYYDNHDSVFMIPVSTDEIRSMKIIGQSVDFDIITGNRNTIIF